jgi:23S rRNA pseudouridine1911/1915/1917 synthase
MSPGADGPGRGAVRRLDASAAREDEGVRLDRWLAVRLGDLSRTRVRGLIDEGRVLVDGRPARAAHRLRPGEHIEARIPPPPPQDLLPEPLPLQIVFEDADLLVVDKPAGLVTHPGAGRAGGTLAAAALAHAPEMAGVGGPGRPGVVHRLDKGTSGLIVLARTRRAYESLVAQLAARQVTRRYLCLVHGRVPRESDTIDAPIGRDPRSRVRMAVVPAGRGKRAITRYRVLERFAGFTWLECRLLTGRTHQIRVHLASIGHPVAGDATYGRRRSERAGAPDSPQVAEALAGLGGVALHAAGLGFLHPATGLPVEFVTPLPGRIERVLERLRSASD